MAITRTPTNPDETDVLRLAINNGDLKALGEIVEKWGFRDEESALRFALAILSVTQKGTLIQEKPDGASIALKPTESLLKTP